MPQTQRTAHPEKINRRGQYVFSILILLALLTLSACDIRLPQAIQPQNSQVDPIFREYYNDIGGEAVFGKALSDVRTDAGIQCQFVQAAKLCFNPADTGPYRFFLAPVGLELVTAEQPLIDSAIISSRLENGFAVYSAFIPLVDQLKDEPGTGRPMTNVRYNYEQGRIEQYFEKVGFYLPFNQPAETAKLIPYGALACNGCSDTAEVNTFRATAAGINSPFSPFLDRLGGPQLSGKPLAPAYVAADGNVEQVFENVVVYAPQNDPLALRFRPIAAILGMPVAEPGKRLYGMQENMVFYPTSGELGYHVPVMFDQRLTASGGMNYSGLPLSDPYQDPTDNVTRQCFQSYCLDYDPLAVNSYYTRMVPLGERYLKTLPDLKVEPTVWPVMPVLGFELTKEKPEVANGEAQSIFIRVFQLLDNAPVQNVPATLELTLPDGATQTFNFNPTNAEGSAVVALQTTAKYPNGTLMQYKVCLDSSFTAGVPTCHTGSYLIWGK